VKAWVLLQADGTCESCGEPAPFTSEFGEPFLEVHHLRSLAENGSDTVENSVAVCPNCHREMHYGSHRVEVAKRLYAKVSRLIRE
jgi:5-methylcytosine-specific restriction protein A